MKKIIYIAGMVCLSVLLMGTLFKAMHFPGAAILLSIGLLSIALLFLPIALYHLIKSTDDSLLKFVYYAGFISFSIDFVGSLFKILHWPGANWFMIIGVPLPFVLFLPAYIVYHNKRKLKSDLSFFGIILFMIYLGVFSTMLAINVNYNNAASHYQSAHNISSTNQFLSMELPEKNGLIINMSAKQIVKNIEVMKQKLAIASYPEIKDFSLLDGSFNYATIREKDKKLSYQVFNDAGLQSINNQLLEFYKLHGTNDKNTVRLINEIEVYRLPQLKNETPLITNMSVIAVLNVLTDWQNKVLLIEYLHNQNTKFKS